MKRHSLFFAGVFCLLLISFVSPASAYENQKENAQIYVTVDVSPPEIENVRATNIGTHSADVKWDTDEPGTSLVEYGIISPTENVSDNELVRSHSVELNGLASNTSYKYRVKSVDTVGNENWSDIFSFETEIIPPPPPTFGLSLTPSLLTVRPGDSGTVLINLKSFRGYSRTADLTADLPAGVSAEFTPENGVPAFTSTLELTVAENVSFGPYELTVNATGALGEEKSADLQLQVVPRSHFEISVSPSSATIAQGKSTMAAVEVENIGGYDNLVGLSAENHPDRLNVSFLPENGVPPFESTMHVTAENNLTPATYFLRIKGRGTGGTTFSNSYNLTVKSSPTVVESTATVHVENAPPGSPLVLRPENMVITSVHIIPEGRISNASLFVQELNKKPEGIPLGPPLIYGYTGIGGENIDGDRIENNLMSFRVEWSWIRKNKVDPESISMYHYEVGEGLWKKIPTRIIGSNKNYISYLASAHGLSIHVISREAFFELSDLTVPEKVGTGKTAEIKVKVKNAGTIQGTYSVTLKVDNEVADYRGVTLDSGNSQTISLNFTREEPGTYQVGVDGLTGEVTFEKPAAIPYYWILLLIFIVGIVILLIWLWRRSRD